MIELKRCPFCGDEVEIVPTGLYHWKYAIHHKSKTECILDANAFALPYEEEDAARMWNTRADRKTENSSEIPNNSTISKMEQVDKDINVRSKDEPQINASQHVQHVESVETMSCQECRRWIYDDRWGWFCPLKGQDECKYESKNEPQTDNLFTDKYGDVWEWRGNAWYCISGDEPQSGKE